MVDFLEGFLLRDDVDCDVFILVGGVGLDLGTGMGVRDPRLTEPTRIGGVGGGSSSGVELLQDKL